ncbi:hypothetical protein [Parasphingorhabdus halotolerans]|uniref:Tudor domain-containing protein n=1 Tax=Parasphingorhabdus halotolerans TaxID=2725558 RepID=A0A6H2DM60_9SPHN|nr:hypothetical protein [Parasphingorhabdus halotolerans]QJB69073.1 hypothetical protein HF685_07065 [Parasphingorhabdus halotolerans]
MKKLLIIAGSALAIAGSSAAYAQSYGQGQWVLSRSAVGGSHYYPGVVASASGNQVTINFDDGTTETRPASQVRPYDWRVGSFIRCIWRPDGNVYGAMIQNISGGGTKLTIRYVDDGIVATVKTGECYSD